ncbi:hypothetical protein ONO39_26730, partial [Salmonella enterica subsp. enterica serovar Anatum]|nr:hypothetical protein [Salmonella enterica subsp. enterica serovar Anatum]
SAFSLSATSPHASYECFEELVLLIVAAWRTYYFLGLISQTIFARAAGKDCDRQQIFHRRMDNGI